MTRLASFCSGCGKRLPRPGEPCRECHEDDCPFCGRISQGEYLLESGNSVAFEPLNPVTPGHLLVVSREHVIDALDVPSVTAGAMQAAAEIARKRGDQCNLITSAGRNATQSVFHLHIHIIPRTEGDGLALPWDAGRA